MGLNNNNYYNIPVNQQTILWLDTERGAGSTPSLIKEGVYHPDRNIYRFWLEVYKTATLM
jgi:hypothetical protein